MFFACQARPVFALTVKLYLLFQNGKMDIIAKAVAALGVLHSIIFEVDKRRKSLKKVLLVASIILRLK